MPGNLHCTPPPAGGGNNKLIRATENVISQAVQSLSATDLHNWICEKKTALITKMKMNKSGRDLIESNIKEKEEMKKGV